MILNRKELAELFGKSEETIRAWTDEGMPILSRSKGRSGSQYVTADCIRWYVEREKQRRTGGGQYDYLAERARRAHHLANRTELEAQHAADQLLDAQLIDRAWKERVEMFRRKLLPMAPELARTAMAANSLREVEERTRDVIYRALNEHSVF